MGKAELIGLTEALPQPQRASTGAVPAAVGVSVVILAFNEEANIAHAVRSVSGWADAVFVVDSFSTDRTVEIACSLGCTVVTHRFENYGAQRNFALSALPIRSEWVLFLDADEWLPAALKDEIRTRLAAAPVENGFFLKFRFMWMGRWIRRGYYPTWILRLFRLGKARCEERSVNEHLIVDGATARLENDFVHEDRKGLGDWIAKHNRYATREAEELVRTMRAHNQGEIDARLLGSQAQRKRWLRNRLWNHLPPLVRPFIYFAYRYVFTGAFLEGRAAFVFHFMHALWYQLLIDTKYLELRGSHPPSPHAATQAHQKAQQTDEQQPR